MKNKKPTRKRNRCHNCKHAGDAFKINCVTHMHCQHPARLSVCTSPWDTLQEFWNTCDKHEAFEIPKEIDRTIQHDDTPF